MCRCDNNVRLRKIQLWFLIKRRSATLSVRYIFDRNKYNYGVKKFIDESANKKKNLVFCIIGALFTLVLGSLSHFFFEWSGNETVVGILFAVNESVWEHLKLIIFPTLVWFAVGLPFMRKTNNYAFAAFVSTAIGMIVIPCVFYAYTSFTGESILAVDIATFVVAVLAGYAVAFWVMCLKESDFLFSVAIAGLIAIIAAYLTLTLYAPQKILFLDPVSGGYGIPV